jgi:hypothetical protein
VIPVATVAIVNYRTPELAVRCAESALHSIENGLRAEVRIVDVSDGPGTVTDPPPNVPVVYAENVGYGAALNLGFAGALSPLLIGCNADVEFPVNGVLPLVELFDDHPKLGVLGPRQVSPGGQIVHAGMGQLGDTSGGRYYAEPDQGQGMEQLLEVAQVSGSVLLIRRLALEQIEGMPVTPLYFEDSLLCHRLRRAGWVAGYSGLRTFVHHVAASPEPVGTSRAALAQVSHEVFCAEVTRRDRHGRDRARHRQAQRAGVDPETAARIVVDELLDEGIHLVSTPKLAEREPAPNGRPFSPESRHVMHVTGILDDQVVQYSGSLAGELWYTVRNDDRFLERFRRDVALHWLRAVGKHLGLPT